MLKQKIRNQLDIVFSNWAKKHNIEPLAYYMLEEPPKNIPCDLACNFAMIVAKKLKSNPKKIAEELCNLIIESLNKTIAKVEIAGSGFLNLFINDDFLYKELSDILRKQSDYGKNIISDDNKVLIEFVSANPTGPLHIGHGRGAAIGDSIARIFAFTGSKVKKEYYVNNVGNQIDLLGKSVESRYKDIKGEKAEFPQDGYKGDYIKSIAEKYNEKTKNDFREYAVNEILNIIKSDLKYFDVDFDNWFFESQIAQNNDKGKSFVEELCEWLKLKGFAYEKDGALWFESAKLSDDKDRVLRRNDGRYTYLASDIAYHKNKLDRGFKKLINLWGADHHGYVQRMKSAMKALGSEPQNLIIILYQLVSLVREGKPVSMSTRSGEFITLKEVVDEVGKDACRFFFLLRAPDSQLEFDLELAKKQSNENPVFYVQYVHARCHSIFREASNKNLKVAEDLNSIDFSLLNSFEERMLIKKLILFPDILSQCVKSLTPHFLTSYLMDVADIYHKFYEKCRVLTNDEELTKTRLVLIKAVTIIIKNGLNLIGVSAPLKM